MSKSIFFLLALLPQLASAQLFEWGKQLGGSSADDCQAITTDQDGNLYTTGYFNTSADFDPGTGELQLNTNGGQDVFIQKLNAKGELIWVKQIGGPGQDIAHTIALDDQGNIYVAGLYSQTVDFDPGMGTSTLSTTGIYEPFLIKLDAQGELMWARQFRTGNLGLCNHLVIDHQQAIYLVGEFKGDLDADPGPAEQWLSSSPNWNGFFIKLDIDGNLAWARSLGEYYDFALQNAAVAKDGGLIATGWFRDQVDFDPGPETYDLQSAGDYDVFILKLSAEGGFEWAKRVGSTGTDISHDLKTDPAGNIFVGGRFTHTVDFDPGSGIFPLVSSYADVFILKLDQTGRFSWAVRTGGGSFNDLGGLAVDESGNVYATGFFVGQADFDPGPGQFYMSAPTYNSAFFWKLDFAGNFIWARMSQGLSAGNTISVNRSGQVYAGGSFNGTVKLNPGGPQPPVTANGSKDIFIQRISQGWDFQGNVFWDQNSNGQQDNQEIGLTGIQLTAPGSVRYALTNQAGDFHFYDNILGDTVWPKITYPNWSVTPAFAVPDSTQQGLIFAASGSAIRDVCISIVERTPFRPGFPTELEIQVTNVGMLALDTVPVRLKFVTQTAPDPLEILSVNPAPYFESTTEIKWLVEDLDVYETQTIRLAVRTPVTTTIAQLVQLTAGATLADDANPFNNGSRILTQVVGSFDPNDKQVSPAIIAPSALDTTDLRYVIRFQNTGNYPADFVVIRDTLPEALDLSTLRLLAASHDYTWRISGPRVLEVRFDHINLPDSTSNEPESHGYVAFTVRAKDGLSLGDSIQNRAAIYFDYNAPVITNYAVMNVTNTVSAKAPALPSSNFSLNPNPVGAHQPITLELDSADLKDLQVDIYDETGKKVLSQNVVAFEKRLILGGLPAGSYFIQLRAGRQTSGKVLLVK